ncbi:MAG: deoxyribodipyrimidine photo-lyase [Deltaproteobacteria bacterium]|nr:deoxyribodipyrimidine photo-lyase [Deltaproteobacteria bacterium]
MRTLVWFRGKDLRVSDHRPLADAVKAGEIVPVFVVDPYFFAKERARAIPNRMRFLVESLAELSRTFEELGSRLYLFEGKSTEVVPRLARELSVDRVVAHRWSEPLGVERDRRVAKELGAIPFELYEGETLASPGQVLTGSGTPFSVFTPFSRAFAKVVEIGPPTSAPRELPPPVALPPALQKRLAPLPTAESLGLPSRATLVRGGESEAKKRLAEFLRGPAPEYPTGRDEMGRDGTSRLSQDLKFGTLSAKQVWRAAQKALDAHPNAWRIFANELVWREFAYDVLRARPEVLEHPFRPEWKGFPWRDDAAAWRAWQEGATGYPVVDASARQLLMTGFVHNRARMISASFLCKHLLLDFRLGEAHYMEHLTDGDWAANDLGWQWSAGCGVDAQPWFRVFNPVTQGKKFDAKGDYVRRWVPELAKLPDRWLHAPWEAPPEALAKAGIELGRTYPKPIVDHAFARGRFLAAAEGHLARRKQQA